MTNITFKNMNVYIPIKNNYLSYYVSLNFKNFEENLNQTDLNYLRKLNDIIINTTILKNFKIQLIVLGSI